MSSILTGPTESIAIVNWVKLRSFVYDALVVLLFVVIGRSSHSQGESVGSVIATAAPFGIGLLVAWGVVAARKITVRSSIAGVLVATMCALIGQVIRVADGTGTKLAFVLVSIVFLNLGILGWRFALQMLNRKSK